MEAAISRATECDRQAGICPAANTKLIGIANDNSHLYQGVGFRLLLLSSYEPPLGLKKKELENTIRDCEDRILDEKYCLGSEPAKIGSPK